jgi:hypothetical protein
MNDRPGISMAAVMVGGLLAACTTTMEEYPRDLEEAICEWQHGCHLFERQRDCVAALAIDRDPAFDYLRIAVDAGRIEFDADAAERCFDAIRERGCEERYPDEEPACAAVLRGRMGRNGPCMASAECADDGICGFDPSCSEQCCVGACRVRADPLAIGEPCGGSISCVEEGYCDFASATPLCVKRVEAGGDCSLGQACDESSGCDGATCRAYKDVEEGERCDGSYTRCVEPARCFYEADDVERCRIAPQLGAPCDREGPSCARFDTHCDEVSKLCVLLPTPGAGCGDGQCAEYASCENLTGGGSSTCARKAAAGEVCGYIEAEERYAECLGDLQCDETARCALPIFEQGELCPVPED